MCCFLSSLESRSWKATFFVSLKTALKEVLWIKNKVVVFIPILREMLQNDIFNQSFEEVLQNNVWFSHTFGSVFSQIKSYCFHSYYKADLVKECCFHKFCHSYCISRQMPLQGGILESTKCETILMQAVVNNNVYFIDTNI